MTCSLAVLDCDEFDRDERDTLIEAILAIRDKLRALPPSLERDERSSEALPQPCQLEAPQSDTRPVAPCHMGSRAADKPGERRLARVFVPRHNEEK